MSKSVRELANEQLPFKAKKVAEAPTKASITDELPIGTIVDVDHRDLDGLIATHNDKTLMFRRKTMDYKIWEKVDEDT